MKVRSVNLYELAAVQRKVLVRTSQRMPIFSCSLANLVAMVINVTGKTAKELCRISSVFPSTNLRTYFCGQILFIFYLYFYEKLFESIASNFSQKM
jgi:hypothetical protein